MNKFKALYFPYARSVNRVLLKQAVLLFDEIWFIDPMERYIREYLDFPNGLKKLSESTDWSLITEDYDYLFQKGVIKRLNPWPIIREYDGLLAQAMQCDLKDRTFLELASKNASKSYWGILKSRIPESFYKKAQKFAIAPTRFWRQPTQIKSPVMKDESYEKYYGTYTDFSSPYIMTIQHDYIPISLGYSININNSLLISELNNLSFITDDIYALRLLYYKFSRAKKKKELKRGPSQIFLERTPKYLLKYNMVALNIVQRLLPIKELDKYSFEKILQFKKKNSSLLEKFRNYVSQLTNKITEEIWSAEVETQLLDILDNEVVPEVNKLKDQLETTYESIFGTILKNVISITTPSLLGSVLVGLSPGEILTLGCTAIASALTISTSEIVDVWRTKRDLKKNSFVYLLSLK